MSTEQISLFDMLPEQEDATNHREPVKKSL